MDQALYVPDRHEIISAGCFLVFPSCAEPGRECSQTRSGENRWPNSPGSNQALVVKATTTRPTKIQKVRADLNSETVNLCAQTAFQAAADEGHIDRM
jgi:hypothetical protein